MPKYERSYWRDTELLNWHCINNVHCRCAGVQLLMLEYNHATPVFVVEYRRYEDGIPNTDHPVYRAIASLAGRLPFFIVYCDRPTLGFCLSPQNQAARSLNVEPLMSEAEYVGWLHAIRNERPMPSYPRGLGTARPTSRPSQPMTVPSLLLLDGARWPGSELSERHRLWGDDLPMVDIDYPLIDNNDAQWLALIEYKHWRAREPNWQRDTSLQALRRLAEDMGLPFLVMRYWPKPWRFQFEGPPDQRPLYPDYAATGEQWIAYLRHLRRREAA